MTFDDMFEYIYITIWETYKRCERNVWFILFREKYINKAKSTRNINNNKFDKKLDEINDFTKKLLT